MGRTTRLLLGLALGLWAGFGRAQEPVLLDAALDSIPLAGHVEWLRDGGARLTIEDVLKPDIAMRFAEDSRSRLDFGFDREPYWYRIRLHNPASAPPAERIFEILTTARVLEAIEGSVEAQSVGDQTIRGFSKPVQVVRVLERTGVPVAT